MLRSSINVSGAPANFRPWDNQLRQSILLHTRNAVIAKAPIDGFLHEKNNLDTLGIDARESTYRFQQAGFSPGSKKAWHRQPP